MIKKILDPVEPEELMGLAKEIGGFYVKVVVDIERQILVAGARMHIDEEQVLLNDGSLKGNLWGGGYDLDMKQVTFDSIINNRPGVNSSSDILDPEVRKKFEIIVRKLLNV